MKNYEAVDGPIYTGTYATTPSDFDGILRVVSWNIKFSEKIPEALAEFQQLQGLELPDIVLLQEMDETGVELISETLGYNYVYYPASVHTYHQRNFGNAILARWPIHNPQKLILPHKNPKNGQRRIAARAVVVVDGNEILTYSVHTETFWLPWTKRNDQMQYLIDDVDPSYQYVIIGGDFNTLSPRSKLGTIRRFQQAGFQWATKDAGFTAQSSILTFTLDYIFTKGLTVLDAGKGAESYASDHVPVWAELVLP